MPNIFDGMAKMSDEDIIEQIVLLENINVTNISKPVVQKAKKKVIGAINYLGKVIGKNPEIKEPDVKNLWDLIEEKRSELVGTSRKDLDNRIFQDLKKKLKFNYEEPSYDMISAKVIEEAAEVLKIDKNLTPAQKADSIHRRFYERMLVNTQKYLKKQDKKAAKKTEKALDDSLKTINEDQREQIRQALKVENLTGKTIRNALLKAGAPAAILAAISVSGFGTFVALTTIIHAIFTTILGITLPFAVYTSATSILGILTGPIGGILIFGVASYQILNGTRKLDRELFAQIVWCSVTSYGKQFTPKYEEMPSYLYGEEKEKASKEQDEFEELVREKEKAEEVLRESKDKLYNLYKDLEVQNKIIDEEKRKRIDAEENLKSLKALKEEFKEEKVTMQRKLTELKGRINKKMCENDIDKVRFLQEEYLKSKVLIGKLNSRLEEIDSEKEYKNEVIEKASKEIEEKQNTIKNLIIENKKVEQENDFLQQENEKLLEKVKIKEKQKRTRLAERWEQAFDKFIIEPKAIRDAIKFNKKDLICVERALYELYYSDDPISLSRGKIKGVSKNQRYDHMAVLFQDGFPTRILYEVLSNQEKSIRIIEIYKHNKKKYQ